MRRGKTALITNKDGSKAEWHIDFMPKSYKYRCRLTVDGKVYRGLGGDPERSMRNAVNQYLRAKERI